MSRQPDWIDAFFETRVGQIILGTVVVVVGVVFLWNYLSSYLPSIGVGIWGIAFLIAAGVLVRLVTRSFPVILFLGAFLVFTIWIMPSSVTEWRPEYLIDGLMEPRLLIEPFQGGFGWIALIGFILVATVGRS